MVEIVYTQQDKKKPNIGVTKSILAGVGSGIFKIFEGGATLGATLLDLGVDENRAEAVEAYFDEINPFDEMAEATAAGKITELIVNIGIPGGLAFKIGSGLTKATLRAKDAGTYLSRADKTKRFAKGAGLGGVAEGVFVGDVEDAGSFGDLLGGPSKLDRESKTPQAELLNRFKFGLEGVAFTGLLGGAGAGIKKLRSTEGSGKAITDPFSKWVDRWISRPLRSRGPETKEGFLARMEREGALAVDTNVAENAMIKMETVSERLLNNVQSTIGRKAIPAERKKLLAEMNEIMLSNPNGNGLKPVFETVDNELKVTLQGMNQKRLSTFKDKLKNTYKASDADIESLELTMNGMKLQWEKLFTSMGRRLTPESLEQFQKILPGRINTVLDRGYEIFKNNKGTPKVNGTIVMENYAPTKVVLNEAVEQLVKIADDKGLKLSIPEAKIIAEEIVETAELPKGFKLNEKSGIIRANFPDFVLDSVAKEVTDPTKMDNALLSEVTGVARPIIDKLLGKSKSAMSTIVEGTNNLSFQVRQNEYWDNMLKKSDKMKVAWNKWDQIRRTKGDEIAGVAPRPPMFVNNPGEARKYLGGTGNDWKMIGEKKVTDAKGVTRVEGMQEFDKYVDPQAKLKPLTDGESLARVGDEILNPVSGKWALNEVVDAIKGTKQSTKDIPTQLYQNLILYPKATAQMAKTILAPFTHARNFISAAAFAGANGIMPFGNTKDVKAAWNALQVAGPGTRQSNEFYQELLDLGVVNSQVQLGDLKKLLEDVDFGATLNNVTGLNGFLKKLSKAKKFAQDAYTAEDDFWKIFSYLGEKGRMKTSFHNAGLRDGMEFVDPQGVKRIYNDQYLKEASAEIVRNNIPNYAYVSEFIKGLRKLPVGNFVAFPAEIMRTGTNIVSTALDEIFYSVKINGKTVNPLRGRGMQRLMGMGITTTALPLGTVAAAQAIYDVNQDELDAMRRYVADWSKNSVLIPFRDDEGNLEYIDFSHLNAYDTLTRPIQTVINAVQEGRGDKDGIMDDFLKGLIDSTKEIGSPFFTEAIWTKSLLDIAPVLGRDGMTTEGREVWNEKDSTGDKLFKAVAHVVEAQAPLNWKQLKRLGISMMPIDSKGSFDERGNQYQLGNEALGIAGLRRVKVDPETSIKYKINKFQKGIRDSRKLFTSETLKGGPVDSEQIVDAYINANRATFETNQELYKDMQAAKVLGMSDDSIQTNMDARGASSSYDYLSEGQFRPFSISSNVEDLLVENAEKLGLPNPLDSARDVMDRIENILLEVPLGGLFPNIKNPFKTSMLPDINLGPASNASLPPMPGVDLNALNTGTQFGNIDPVSRLTVSEQIYLDPLEKVYTAGKRKQNNPPRRV
jgi:hypothetical protein